LPCSGALPAAQVPFLALPDDLLGGILRRAWADRPPRPAAAEVRAAADLASVCRRVRAMLRNLPLPLALDFSVARLSGAQRRWLLDRAQAGRVEAASFDSKDALWKHPALDGFLARHGGTLLHLSGVPLQRFLTYMSPEQRPGPALDLSGLRLTKLGIACYVLEGVLRYSENADIWLWPESLPGTLEELELLGPDGDWLKYVLWGPQPSPGLAGRLPWLRTLRVVRLRGEGVWRIDTVPILQGCPATLAFEVHSSQADIYAHANVFGVVEYVRVLGGGEVHLQGDQEDVATFVDRLCPAGLQAAEVCAEHYIDLGPGAEVVREIISRHGDRFAVEVEPHDSEEDCDEEDWYRTRPQRLAWRRWPAPGAPGLQAARAAHESARAWLPDFDLQALEQW